MVVQLQSSIRILSFFLPLVNCISRATQTRFCHGAQYIYGLARLFGTEQSKRRLKIPIDWRMYVVKPTVYLSLSYIVEDRWIKSQRISSIDGVRVNFQHRDPCGYYFEIDRLVHTQPSRCWVLCAISIAACKWLDGRKWIVCDNIIDFVGHPLNSLVACHSMLCDDVVYTLRTHLHRRA